MNKFWFVNRFLIIVFFIGYFAAFFLLIHNVKNLDVDYTFFQLQYAIITLSVVQFMSCLVAIFFTQKQQIFKSILTLFFILSAVVVMVFSLLALMGGFLGDM